MKKRVLSGFLAALMVLSLVIGFPITVRAASSMTVSAELISVLKTMEGFSAKPYWDYSQWTVGYGTKCPDDKLEYYKANGITEAEALALLDLELQRFEAAVNGFIDKYGLTLKQHQFDALVSFSYNCGEAWMNETTGYFNTAVREGGSISEFLYGICLYSTAGGEYILIKRRLCEANMYINGVYKAYNADSAGNPDHLKYVFLDGNGGNTRYAVYGYDANENSPVNVSFSSIPTGTDSAGKAFAYQLEGWYTADGVKVDTLDSSLKNGQVLYARWSDPEGNVAALPKGETEEMTVTVTGDSVNVRTGPGTYYDRVSAYVLNTAVPITQVYETGGYTWGKSELGWFRLDYTNYAALKAEQSQFPKDGTVTGNGVNVRTGPGTNYDKVGQMNKGQRVTITEEADGGSLRWGKMTNGNWICLDYVLYDEDARKVTGVTLLRQPSQTEYVQKSESLKPEGSVLLVSYEDGSTSALTLTRTMITAYSNDTLGETTVNASYEGYTVSFPVTIIKATITFLNWDGTVISSAQYAYGEHVAPPEAPERESDGKYYYAFSGWDREVKPCAGNAVYTATYIQSTDPDAVVVPQSITSSVYTVSDGSIRKIPAGTTVNALIGGIHENSYISVYDGNTIVGGTALVGTGMTVKLQHAGKTIQSISVIVTGDVNGDGEISITDMINVKSHILGKTTLTDVYAQAADTNQDSSVSITDFVQIKAKLLGKGEITPN